MSVDDAAALEGRLSAADAQESTEIEQDYARFGRDCDTVAAASYGDFLLARSVPLVPRGPWRPGRSRPRKPSFAEALVEQLSDGNP